MIKKNDSSVIGRRQFLALSGSATLGVLAFSGRYGLAGCIGTDSCTDPGSLPCDYNFTPMTYSVGDGEDEELKQCGTVTQYSAYSTCNVPDSGAVMMKTVPVYTMSPEC